jgi:hypothetical protein
MNMNNNLDELSIPLFLSYETDMSNINAKILELTLKKNNWNYNFIGNNTKWINMMDKAKGFYYYLITLPSEKIVILSDSRDVICCRSPKYFMNDYNKLANDKIMISAELFLQGAMDWETNDTCRHGNIINPSHSKICLTNETFEFTQGIPLDKYWKYLNIEPSNIPNRKYVNAGLIAGKAGMLRDALKWIIDNGYEDDQFGFANYVNEFPENIYLDINADILHSSVFAVYAGLYSISIQNTDSPTFAELFGRSAYFLHIPGQVIKPQKVIYKTITNMILYGIGDKKLEDSYNFE